MSKGITSKRVPVPVDNEGYVKFQQYSEVTGIPIARVVNEALNDWMNTIGAARLDAYKKPRKEMLLDNLLYMPAPQA